MKSILIIAAEPSSVLYVERLLEFWKSQNKQVRAYGIGSRKMETLGFECLGYAEDLCAMGLFEVLPILPQVIKVKREIIKRVESNKPEVALLLDYPSFNMNLAKKLKKEGVAVVYYIPPKLWVRKGNGLERLRNLVDKVLYIFPFERELYLKSKINSVFLGNPLLDELSESLFLEEEVKRSRHRYGFADTEHIVALMPGSRQHEIKCHLPIQVKVGRALYKKHGVKICLLIAPNLSKQEIQKNILNLDYPITLIKDEPFRMLQVADSVLSTSGTATLIVALMKKPMVVMYVFSWLTSLIIRFMRRMGAFKVSMISLPNLILERLAVSEMYLENAQVHMIEREMEKIILDKSIREKQIEDFELLSKKLGKQGVTERLAKELESYV